jgi:hypothetical protein
MNRAQITRTLGHMERLREDADEAETETDRRRIQHEYDRLWKSVRPFLPIKITATDVR